MSDLTKRALAESLKRLLAKKPLNKITVRDLVEECGINRTTFYYHFQDVYDLIDWIFKDEGRRALGEDTTIGTWQQGFMRILHLFVENKPLVMNLYHHIPLEHIHRYFYQLTAPVLLRVVENCAKGMVVEDADKRFIADFYKYAFVGILLDWISRDMKPDADVLVQQLGKIIDGEIPRMIEKCRIL